MERNLNIYFTKFLGFEFISELEYCLLVFDDSCEEIFNDKEFSKLATAGHHKKISVIYVKHYLFPQSKCSRKIDVNTAHIISFKSHRGTQQISYIGKQLNNINFLKDSYDHATKQPFGHFLIDLDPKTTDSQRYCSNIVPPGPTIFYLPSSKALITHLTNERERDMYVEANARDVGKYAKKFIKKSSNKFIEFLCECFLNVINGNVPTDKGLLENYETSFRIFFSKETSLRKKRQLLV